MIKRIKKYFYMRRIRKEMQVEILETLTTICMYLEAHGRYYNNPRTRQISMHGKALNQYSEILRKEIREEAEVCKYVY